MKMVPVMTAQVIKRLPLPPSYRWKVGARVGDRFANDSAGRAVVRMSSGFRMALDVSESYERHMYYSGQYAPHLTRLVKHLLKPGDTFVDGGANIGYFSLLAAKLVGPTGQVHAFEPMGFTWQALEKNVSLNHFPQIHSNNQALRDVPGSLVFEVPEEQGKKLGRLATIVQRGQGPTEVVSAVTFDAYAEAKDITHIKLVKLDVEGSEVAAIRGMERLLSQRAIDYLVCELNTALLDALGIPHAALRETLASHGYRAYYLRPRLRGPLYLIDTEQMDDPERYGDYLFVAPTMPQPPTRI